MFYYLIASLSAQTYTETLSYTSNYISKTYYDGDRLNILSKDSGITLVFHQVPRAKITVYKSLIKLTSSSSLWEYDSTVQTQSDYRAINSALYYLKLVIDFEGKGIFEYSYYHHIPSNSPCYNTVLSVANSFAYYYPNSTTVVQGLRTCLLYMPAAQLSCSVTRYNSRGTLYSYRDAVATSVSSYLSFSRGQTFPHLLVHNPDTSFSTNEYIISCSSSSRSGRSLVAGTFPYSSSGVSYLLGSGGLSTSTSNPSNKGAVFGGVGGSIFFFFFVVAIIYCVFRKKNRKNKHSSSSSSSSSSKKRNVIIHQQPIANPYGPPQNQAYPPPYVQNPPYPNQYPSPYAQTDGGMYPSVVPSVYGQQGATPSVYPPPAIL